VNRNDGLIKISARQDNNISYFVISDNGAGIPEGITIENSPGFGMQLINMFIKQIKASIKIERDNGTKFFN
jgi:two-component sensor histidine kinase